MSKRQKPQAKLFKENILGTLPRADIKLSYIQLCKISKRVHSTLLEKVPMLSRKVFVSTKVLKHIYDDHVLYYLESISNMDEVVRSPDSIYENKSGKRGKYLFIREIQKNLYCAVIDVNTLDKALRLEVRTCFKISSPQKYLHDLMQIWQK